MARRVLRIEGEALRALEARIDDAFFHAVELILANSGRVIVSGIGKSGHIARKIAATLASTGTPAYFVHAAEAVHGDLGMIARQDVVVAISHSGESNELLTIVPLVKRRGAHLIAITGNGQSSLALDSIGICRPSELRVGSRPGHPALRTGPATPGTHACSGLPRNPELSSGTVVTIKNAGSYQTSGGSQTS